jgi:hypothetical protein
MTQDIQVPSTVSGHWQTPQGHEVAKDYVKLSRQQLYCGAVPDFELATMVYMADRNSFELIGMQTAARERIRWLSVQLALKSAALEAALGGK